MSTIKDKTLQEVNNNYVHSKEVNKEPEDYAYIVTDVDVDNHVQYFQVTETVRHSKEDGDGYGRQ